MKLFWLPGQSTQAPFVDKGKKASLRDSNPRNKVSTPCEMLSSIVTSGTPINLSRLGGVRLEPRVWSEPGTLDEAVPVHGREDVLLDVVEQLPRHILATDTRKLGEGLLGHTAVLEFAEHQLVVAGQKGARCVAAVAGVELLAADGSEQVVHEHRCLRCDGGGGLGVGQRGGVAEGEDILVLVVLGRGFVNVHPTSGISYSEMCQQRIFCTLRYLRLLTQGRLGHPVPSLLRWHHVQETVLLLHLLAFLSQVLERGDLVLGVHTDEIVLE